MSKTKRLWIIGAVVAASTLALIFAARTISHAGDALDAATHNVASQSAVAFEQAALERRAPQGFSWIGGAASGYADAAIFGGDLFVLSSSELTQYRDGSRLASYRTGFELPPSALIALRTGTPAGASRPELLVATQSAGYLAFDGDSWRQVRLRDNEKLLSLHVLGNGRVLLGTDRSGLLAHDARGLAPLQDLLRDKRVTAIAGTDESDIWIGTLDKGLFRYRAGQLQPVTPVPDKRILCIAIDGARVWAGTPLGIAEFVDGAFRRELAAGYFVPTLAVHKDKLVAGTLEDGVLEIPLDQRSPKPFRRQMEALAQGEIRKVFHTAEGREMVLTPTRLIAGDDEVLRAPESRLADGNIAALAPEEATGRLWVGYFDRGLDILDAEDATTPARHVEDDTVFCVNRIVHDAANRRTVVATGNGLAFLDAGGQIQRVMHKADGLIANHATDVLLRPNAALTVATPAGVTFVESRGQTSSIYAFHGLVNNHVYTLGECQGRLIAGTLGGISTLEGGIVKASYTTANSSLGHNWITAIADTGSACLVGTYGAGVMTFGADGTWQTFPDLTQPAVRGFEVNPNALASSPRGAYAGTLGKGLAVWNKATNRWHFVRDGLPSLNVTAVAVRNGIVYAGTDNGLVRIEEQVLVR